VQAVQRHCILLFFFVWPCPNPSFADTLRTHVVCYAHFWASYVRGAHSKPKMSLTGLKVCLGTTQNVHNRTQSVFERHQEVFGHHPKCAEQDPKCVWAAPICVWAHQTHHGQEKGHSGSTKVLPATQLWAHIMLWGLMITTCRSILFDKVQNWKHIIIWTQA
jgi:hypothetical protein